MVSYFFCIFVVKKETNKTHNIMKKVYVAQILVEDIHSNTCSVELFSDLDDAKKWADEEIDIYGEECDGSVIERADLLYQMNSGDIWVTIEIVEKEIH